MVCITCGSPIPVARLAAIPNAVQCVRCVEANGDEPKLKGRMIWESKTGPTIEIGTRLATQKGRWGYAPSLPFNQQEGHFGVAQSVADAKDMSEACRYVRAIAKGKERPDEGDL